ncbi:MAG: hypothetical protein AAFN77_07320 [Planctomycetota bacterium]
MQEHDPIKNPRPEDLHSYGVVNALVWFAILLAIALTVYYFVFR